MNGTQGNLPDQPLLGTVGTVLFPFLRALGHDINSPLTGILGYSQLLAETLPEDSPDRADVLEILQCAEQCRQLVAMLSRLSRPEADSRVSNLPDLLWDVEHLSTAVGRKHGVELAWVRRGDLPAAVAGNPWILRSGLLALVGAGVNRTPSGQGLEVTAEGSSAGLVLHLTCSDREKPGTPGYHPGELSSLTQASEILASQGVDVQQKPSEGRLVLEVHLAPAS